MCVIRYMLKSSKISKPQQKQLFFVLRRSFLDQVSPQLFLLSDFSFLSFDHEISVFQVEVDFLVQQTKRKTLSAVRMEGWLFNASDLKMIELSCNQVRSFFV
jgi:hypothetical protein